MTRFALSVATLIGTIAIFNAIASQQPAFGAETTQPANAKIHPAITLVKSGDFAPKGDYVVGYKFTALVPITVTDLGVFDKDGDGVLKGTEAIKIGLWDSSGTLLVATDLDLKTKAEDGVFYAPIKPLPLATGDYVIAYVSPEDGQRYWFGAQIKTAPEIQWVTGLYGNGRDLNPPTNVAPGASYFGPNFRLSAGAMQAIDARKTEGLAIEQPDDRAIFQRDEHNLGKIPIVCMASPSATKVRARAVDLKSGKSAGDWVELTAGKSLGTFEGALSVPGGWYRLEVQAEEDGKTVTADVDHVGIGEVFLTCGQSNSCNHGRPRQSPQDDRVSALDWQTGHWRHADDPQPGAEGTDGSPWPLLGDLLVKKYDVPVGFESVGVGATAVEQWLPGGDLYKRVRMGLERLGPHGVRAILWHQGEQDSVAGTSTDEYYHALSLIIARSRRDAGFNVPWGVALVSYHPSAPAQNYPPIIAAQRKVIDTEPDVFAGPATDDFHLHDYMTDGVHFNAAGLAAHAKGWADAIPIQQ